MKRRTAPRPIAILSALGVIALAFLLANVAGQGSHFNPDESRWISRAHYLAALADPTSNTWNDRYMARGQPPLGSYAMGLGLLLQGRDLKTNPPWDFNLPWEVNIAVGNKPVPEDLSAGRRTSAALVGLTALVLIPVARTFVPLPWAIAAGVLYAVHPFTTYIGSLAMSDALFGLIIALSAWAAAAFARNPGWWRAMILGGLLGLGGATKLSPLGVAAGLTSFFFGAAIISTLHDRRDSARQYTQASFGLAIGISAIVTFIAVYPYLWPDPIGRTGHLFAFRTEEMETQASDWPVMAVPNRLEALRRVHANFSDRYNVSDSVTKAAGVGSAAPWLRQIEVVAATLGVAIMIEKSTRAGPHSPRALILAVLGGLTVITILGMRSEFDRYHLPMALLGAVGAAVAMNWLAEKALRQQSEPVTAPGGVGATRSPRSRSCIVRHRRWRPWNSGTLRGSKRNY
jgi:hypothetical protein